MSSSPYLNLFFGFAVAWLLTSFVAIGYSVFVMRERLHRIAIIGMLVTAVLGASLATRDLIHHSNPPHSSVAH